MLNERGNYDGKKGQSKISIRVRGLSTKNKADSSLWGEKDLE